MLNVLSLGISENLKNIFYKIRFVYFGLLLAFTLCREIVPLYDIVSNELISYLFFGVGLLLIGITFLIDSKLFFKRHSLIMLAFIAICILSSLINIKLGLIANLKAIGWMTIYFYVAFFCALTPQKYDSNHLTAITCIIVVLLGIFVAFSIPMYIYNVDYTYFNFNAAMVTSNQGFSLEYMRLWGIFNEANRAAVYSLVGLSSAIYLFTSKKNIIVKILTAIAALLFLTFLVLTQSRTALLILLVTSAFCGFYIVFNKFSFPDKKRWTLSILSAVAVVVAFYGIFTALQGCLPYIKQAIYNNTPINTIADIHKKYDSVYKKTSLNVTDGFWIDSNFENSQNPDNDSDSNEIQSNSTPPNNIEYEELKRPDVDKEDNISNGRIKRWKDGLLIFTKAPILGTSPRYVSDYAKIHCPETYIAKYDYVIHNGYLEVLVGTGILGFLPIITLLISVTFIAIKKTFNRKFDFRFLFAALITIIFICMSLLQTEVFFILTFGGSLFWYSLGAITRSEE